MQVILESREYSVVRKVASSEGKSISDWVRGLIRERLSRKKGMGGEEVDVVKKLEALQLPAPPIDQMLREIEEGRF